MDKALFRAYVKELVKEAVEEEVKKVLPKLLGEAVAEVKSIQESAPTTSKPKSTLSRAQLAEMMGLTRVGDTIIATSDKVMPTPPRGVQEDNPAFQAINKDYSAMMKALKLV
jgi:hypothetical protein